MENDDYVLALFSAVRKLQAWTVVRANEAVVKTASMMRFRDAEQRIQRRLKFGDHLDIEAIKTINAIEEAKQAHRDYAAEGAKTPNWSRMTIADAHEYIKEVKWSSWG